MGAAWFLVVTLCSAGGADCSDYIVDGGMSFTDCRDAVAKFPDKPALYSLRCERGDVVRAPSDPAH